MANNSLSSACKAVSGKYAGEMEHEDLSDWILTTAAVAVRLMPGLAILSARSLARLVYRVLGLRPEGEAVGC